MNNMSQESDWIDFGPEKEQASKDAKTLSESLGKPVYLAYNGENYFCIPAVKMIGRDIPKDAELIGKSR